MLSKLYTRSTFLIFLFILSGAITVSAQASYPKRPSALPRYNSNKSGSSSNSGSSGNSGTSISSTSGKGIISKGNDKLEGQPVTRFYEAHRNQIKDRLPPWFITLYKGICKERERCPDSWVATTERRKVHDFYVYQCMEGEWKKFDEGRANGYTGQNDVFPNLGVPHRGKIIELMKGVPSWFRAEQSKEHHSDLVYVTHLANEYKEHLKERYGEASQVVKVYSNWLKKVLNRT